MKRLLLFFMLIARSCAAQDTPIKWELSVFPLGDSLCRVQVDGTIDPGWHVYAKKDIAAGVEPLSISFEQPGIIAKGDPSFSQTTKITDPLFNNHMDVYTKNFVLTQLVQCIRLPDSLRVSITGYAASDSSFLPIAEKFSLAIGGKAAATNNLTLNLSSPVVSCGSHRPRVDAGAWRVFWLGIAGGLLALLTPCVFPMVPVTVSFFTGLGKTRKEGIKNALLYGISILGIYLLASVPFHLIGNINPQVFNTISTSAGVNIFFFIIFVFFALSFFGLFELRLPSAVANGAGSKGGIFFMALTLAIVSFSCTGPILGSLLVGSLSSEAGAWQLSAGMAGFGLALALPFALFAMFPNLLKTLPKSGRWMETVKKSLAFVELALALKFLSNADLVQHWGILKREVFIAIWILISLGLAFYLLGIFSAVKVKFMRYHPLTVNGKRAPIFQLVTGILALCFAVYLLPGLTNCKYNELNALSGFPPPKFYSIYKNENKALVNDYDKAVQLAKEQHKPILIDFTGWACVNCRKMEEQVWSKPDIAAIIKDKYILVSLYVDDREKLPEAIRFKGKQLKTVGDKWATFQQENFKQVSQPLYVLLGPNGELLNNPVGYTPSVSEYRSWLECGLGAVK
jgi:thiol:disulfide interchange protein